MNRFALALVLAGLSACAPMPVPTASLFTPTPRRSPTIPFTATIAIATPAATPTAAETATPTALPLITTTPIAYERSPRAILIEADETRALMQATRDQHVPIFRLYGDGLVVFAGERASLSTGLDAVVRVGHLNETEIQTLLAYFDQTGFFSLKDVYQPRPIPPDSSTARITVYLNKAKTVRVIAPDSDATPQTFKDVWARLAQTIPSDAQTFAPSDAYLESTDAGAAGNVTTKDKLGEWSGVGIRLADVTDGATITGNTFAQVSALVARNLPSVLFREGERAYRVRFAPNLPRAAHLTDWVGAILDAPREFDGRTFEIVGYYRGWNVFGEARGNPPVTRSDWVIADDTGAIYVTGAAPQGLDPTSRVDAWSVVRLTARVVYVRLGTSHLEARRVQIVTRNLPSATPTSTPSRVPTQMANTNTPTFSAPVSGADAAIALVKSRFPEVAHINKTGAGIIGASTNITVIAPRQDQWWLVFWEGWGDCPAGCINNRYRYFIVEDGRVTQVGEYARVFNSEKNTFDITGAPMWGVPR
jgi:hypothetical protein